MILRLKVIESGAYPTEDHTLLWRSFEPFIGVHILIAYSDKDQSFYIHRKVSVREGG